MGDDMMFYAIESGKTRISHFANMGDGYCLEYDNNDGLKLYIALNNPTLYEKHCIVDASKRGEKFKISFTEIEGVGFTSYRFGEMWGDCPFEPRLYGKDLDFPVLEKGKGLALNIILLNPAQGGLVEGLRVIGLQHEFSQKFIAWCKKIVNEPFDKDIHIASVNRVFANYDTNELLKHSMFSWEL